MLNQPVRKKSINRLRKRSGRQCLLLRRAHSSRRTDISLRQIKRENAALGGRPAKLNFTSKQAAKFAADGKPQSCAAVFAARAGIRLLESLENNSLLLSGNS